MVQLKHNHSQELLQLHMLEEHRLSYKRPYNDTVEVMNVGCISQALTAPRQLQVAAPCKMKTEVMMLNRVKLHYQMCTQLGHATYLGEGALVQRTYCYVFVVYIVALGKKVISELGINCNHQVI